MSRRGGLKSNRGWGQPGSSRDSDDLGGEYSYYRDRRPNNSQRRVSFKAVHTGKHGKNRISELALKTRLEDDEEMNDFNAGRSDFRYDNGRRRKGSPVPKMRNNHIKKRLESGGYDWFLVTIPHGQNYDREFIVQSIKANLGTVTFSPYLWKQENDHVSFFLDDFKVAEKLLDLDRKITVKGNLKMIIKVRNSIPSAQMDETLKERMKLAMVKRYSPITKALDLERFHADPDLKDAFCPLFRPIVMIAAFDIIHQNIPDLEALNLSNNKIHLLDHFKCIKEKLPCLKILYLENNRIQTLGGIEALRGLPLIELVLNGNPIKDRYRTVYVSEIRKRFPKLVKLDGIDLAPSIGFDISEETLPPPKASFLVNANGADIIRMFIEQYYVIFDSGNRQPLLDAYHENALLSITVATASQQSERITSFWPYNRNLLRRDVDNESRNLKIGKLPIVTFLSKLPTTRHDPQSMAVDYSLHLPNMVSFTLSGVFKELSEDSNQSFQLRSFQRIFVIIPRGSGYIITQDMCHIANVTASQSRTAFNAPAVLPAPVVTNETPNQLPVNVQTQPPQMIGHMGVNIDENTKLRMVQALSEQTHMNLSYSQKCLEDTNWNYQSAVDAFTQLHSKNMVPAEAFAK